MYRTRFVVLGFVLVLILGSTLAIAAQNEKKDGDNLSVPVGTIELNPPEAVEATKSVVEFPHSRHFTNNCLECHHKWDMGPELQGCKTSGCHELTKAPQKSEKIDMVMYYKKAFHEKCMGCQTGYRPPMYRQETPYFYLMRWPGLKSFRHMIFL